jgi:hypothetical protein
MTTSSRPSKGLRITVAIVQGLLALTFIGTGLWKLVTPVPDLAAKMPWMGEVSPGFLHLTAAFDLLAGLGLVLPSLTRVQPKLTVFAAVGCAALMAGAVVFHVSRGEAASTPFNLLLGALSLFVAWGLVREQARRSSLPGTTAHRRVR